VILAQLERVTPVASEGRVAEEVCMSSGRSGLVARDDEGQSSEHNSNCHDANRNAYRDTHGACCSVE
jgi:hypothetical protein